jgi:hypothetical protein
MASIRYAAKQKATLARRLFRLFGLDAHERKGGIAAQAGVIFVRAV